MTVRGKLCRNPFSTIKLSHEDGGSKAVSHRPRSTLLREHTIFDNHDFGFVAARTGAVYSECLGESVIRVDRRDHDRPVIVL
ncbi:hypothetical protein [Mesorhizobium sp. M1348]|uniref:hypothetical protein n=1 Tax=unclassified Mesorhizobium TaxID=325217 RepID=UPI00333D7224